MSSTNQVANTSTTQIVPVQATFNSAGVCTGLIGPGGQVFSPPLSGNTENPSTLSMGGNLIATTTLPTISSGFGTSPTISAVSTFVFKIVVGTGGAANGTITLTLPLSSSTTGNTYFIKNIGNGQVTVNCTSTDTIDKYSNIVLQFTNSSFEALSSGTGTYYIF